MPDNEKPIESHTAADFLQYALENPVQPSPSDDDEETTEQPAAKATEDEKEEDDTSETDDEDGEKEKEEVEDEDDSEKPDEAEDVLDDDEIPQLDPLIAELAKGNPKAEKRVKEIAVGLAKLKTETKDLKADLEATKPKSDAWDSYQGALTDAALAGPTLEKLIDAVAKHHGVDISDLLPNLAAKPAEQFDERGRPIPEWERKGYDSKKEMELDQKYKALEGALQGFQKTQAEQTKINAEAKKQADEKAFVDTIAPRTIRRIEKLENGWKVSKGMVEKAIKEFPQLRDDPVRAVKACFADELKSHYAKAASYTRKSRGHEMVPDTRGKGQTVKAPLQTTAADIYAMLDQ